MVTIEKMIEMEIMIRLHRLPRVVADKTDRPLVTNLVLVVEEVPVVAEILLSEEMIDESVNRAPVEHLRARKEMDQIAAGLHCVLRILEGDRGEVRIVVLFEREIEPLKERPRPRLLRNAERFLFQRDPFLSVLLRN